MTPPPHTYRKPPPERRKSTWELTRVRGKKPYCFGHYKHPAALCPKCVWATECLAGEPEAPEAKTNPDPPTPTPPPMKIFKPRAIKEARDHAAAGGQALHMMTGQWARGWGGPRCFQQARSFAHLFDQNAERLMATAHRLGIYRAVIQKPGTPSQHIDICGRPLHKAEAEAKAAKAARPAGLFDYKPKPNA